MSRLINPHTNKQFTPPPQQLYMFDPKENITLPQLALMVHQVMKLGGMFATQETIDNMQPDMAQHFVPLVQKHSESQPAQDAMAQAAANTRASDKIKQ